jgi:hypothetical protein
MIAAKRLQQATFQALNAMNRQAATGSGSGYRPTLTLGTSNQSGGAHNYNALAFAVIPGTPIQVVVSRTCDILLLAIYTGLITAGANNGLLRINPGTAGSATGGANMGQATNLTTMIYEYLAGVAPGTYTMQLEAAVDNVATTFQVLGSNLTVIQFGY